MEFLSKECYDQLVEEVNHIATVELPKAKDELSEARAKGDLSENFEYHAAKRALRRVMSKLRFKTTVLQNAQVLDASKLDSEVAGLFRKIQITNIDRNMTVTYTIVNPHEADIHAGKISIQSPVAEALLGKKAGDVVEVKVPAGIMHLRIDKISI